MGLLSKEQILNGANRLPSVDVECPELGGSVRIRTMRGAESERVSLLIRASRNDENSPGLQALVVSHCAVDEEGAMLFDSPVEAGALNTFALRRLFVTALKLNKMGRFEESDEEQIKNSEPAPADDSSSRSHPT